MLILSATEIPSGHTKHHLISQIIILINYILTFCVSLIFFLKTAKMSFFRRRPIFDGLYRPQEGSRNDKNYFCDKLKDESTFVKKVFWKSLYGSFATIFWNFMDASVHGSAHVTFVSDQHRVNHQKILIWMDFYSKYGYQHLMTLEIKPNQK